MSRRPNGLKIVTERRLGEVEAPATVYLGKQRERRVKKGGAYLRRCVTIFMLSLFFVMTTPQYSHRYYLSWVSTYLSFFFMLPSVLPTDNTKIKIMLVVTAWNMACGCGVALRYAVRKSQEVCDLKPIVCTWNPYFWAGHSTLCFFFCCAALHGSRWLPPAKGLHRFWRWCGIYFILVALLTFIDLNVSALAGKYSVGSKYRWCGIWNLALACEQGIIGRLCLYNRFKLWMWRYAASIAHITVRTSDDDEVTIRPPRRQHPPKLSPPPPRQHPPSVVAPLGPVVAGSPDDATTAAAAAAAAAAASYSQHHHRRETINDDHFQSSSSQTSPSSSAGSKTPPNDFRRSSSVRRRLSPPPFFSSANTRYRGGGTRHALRSSARGWVSE